MVLEAFNCDRFQYFGKIFVLIGDFKKNLHGIKFVKFIKNKDTFFKNLMILIYSQKTELWFSNFKPHI